MGSLGKSARKSDNHRTLSLFNGRLNSLVEQLDIIKEETADGAKLLEASNLRKEQEKLTQLKGIISDQLPEGLRFSHADLRKYEMERISLAHLRRGASSDTVKLAIFH
jgi:hypothetical protein